MDFKWFQNKKDTAIHLVICFVRERALFWNYDTENICFVLKTTLLESMPAKAFLNKLTHFHVEVKSFEPVFFVMKERADI